jgi:hypothetical protein
LLLLAAGCHSDSDRDSFSDLVVNSLEDLENPPAGTVTLRSALALAAGGQRIVFDESLDGGTVELSIVGEEHTVLKGEVMGMRDSPTGPISYLVGYFDRDYGRSALYARKNVIIDASDLPSGITLEWTGGEGNPARVLAVYGDLVLSNVSVTAGISVAEELPTSDPDDQPWTLARGGALAVWGVARLVDCQLYDNHLQGDFDSSRDRGAFGGGLYANVVDMDNCVVSGNTVVGAGAAGGGVYSVGGADRSGGNSYIDGSSITGNRIQGLFAYGGGVYSDGGGIGKSTTLRIANSTIARNLVEPPFLPPHMRFLLNMGYWRGGGIYASNGSLTVKASTVAENQVHGLPRTLDLGKPNLAGGIAMTIGNAHAVEDLMIGHSIVIGNTVHEMDGETYDRVEVYDHDVFTGSAFYFRSLGYNRFGVLDFSQILVPVGEPDWASLSRKHYPQAGDQDDLDADDVLNLSGGVARSDTILSAGADAPDPAVLHYEPWDSALDRVPAQAYSVTEIFAEYAVGSGGTDDFLSIVLGRIQDHYNLPGFASAFEADFEAFLQTVDSDEDTPGVQPYLDPSGQPILTLEQTLWFGPSRTWPAELRNYPYIEFWHRLDDALYAEDVPELGQALLGDDAWAALFSSGTLSENPAITFSLWGSSVSVLFEDQDQLGNPRPANALGDIGAIEID